MKKLLFVAALLLALTSCQTKRTAINDLRTLSNEMQVYGDNYSLNEWKDAGQRYYNINKRIKNHMADYSDEEVQEISKLNGQCLKSFTQGAIDKVKGAGAAIKSLIDGFLK